MFPKPLSPVFAGWLGYPPEWKMTIFSSIITWIMPWTEEPGGLQLCLHPFVHDVCVYTIRKYQIAYV